MKSHYAALATTVWLMTTIPLFAQEGGNGFLEDFEPKYTTPPLYEVAEKTTAVPTVTVAINAKDTLGKVSKYIYGNNANPYMTQMVDQEDLLNYIRLLSPNVIRFPGGNLSSIYFWGAFPGNPPADAPDSLVDGNTGNKALASYWFGKNTASWTISVDNYYNMLAATNSTGIITINYGYARYGTGPDPVAAAAHYAAEWVRYDDGRTKFWEIGNESFGSWQAGYRIDPARNLDGQPTTVNGELYGKHFLVFADSMRSAAQALGNPIYIGSQLIEEANSSEPARSWNSGFFKQAGNAADFFIVHSYYTNFNENTPAATILNSATTKSNSMMNYMKQTCNQNQVLLKPIALTEWNIFAVGSKQACSFINGMHAAIVLGELAKNGYSMSSRWDLANGYDNGNDHGMFNNGDESGNVPKWNPRPPFFYMYYFQKFFGDHIVSSAVTGSSNVLAYASRFYSGHAGIIIVNKGTVDQVVKLEPGDYGFGEQYYVYSLTGGSDNGEFSQAVYVNQNGPTNATGGPIEDLEELPASAYSTGDEIKFTSPARSVQYILIEPGEHTVFVRNDGSTQKVDHYALYQNYPNPFNPLTTISYSLPRVSTVTLTVYDLMGREITTLAHNERREAGNHEVSFDAANLPSGVYFYRLSVAPLAPADLVIPRENGQTGASVETKRMMLIK